MKRCPTCNRTFTEPNLTFCVDDGSPLLPVEVAAEATVVTPRSDQNDQKDNDWGAVAYRPPLAYVPSEKGSKRIWPWLLIVGGVIVLGLAALAVGVAIFIPKLRERQVTQHTEESTKPPVDPNNNSNQAPENTEKETVETSNTPAPTDKAVALAQLTEIENEWTVANINADKKKLERILADDYVGPATADPNGPTQGKTEYINTIRRDTQIQKWEFKDLELTLRGDRATLTGKVHFTIQQQVAVYDFTDRFVWRNGRWQATGSQVTPRNGSGTDL
jgi:hypothetical protein